MVAERPEGLPGPRRRRRGVPDRVIELRRVRAGELVEHDHNWRRHPESQRRALRAMLKEIGYADALLAREEDGRLVLLDGHLRRSLDPEQVVPVLVLDLTSEEGDKLLATLDPLAGMARPDPDALASLLGRVHTASAAVRELLDQVARGARVPALGRTDPEEAPALPRRTTVRAGELWALGSHRLLCGDATNEDDLARVCGGHRPAVLWTDPPYGVGYRGKTPQSLRIENDRPGELEEMLRLSFAAADAVLAPGSALYVCHPAGPLQAVFLGAFMDTGWRLRQSLVWVKDSMVLGHADYPYRHEPILYGRKPAPGRWGRGHLGWHGGLDHDTVFEVPRPRASRDHPTAKPVELIRRCLLNTSAPGDAVLDPFAGSGSAVIACEQTGRRCLAVDIDPRYVQVAIHRWERFTGARAELLERRGP